MYVCFDKDTGKINSITNELPDSVNNFIEVETEEVSTLLSGKEPFSSYIVEFDPLDSMLKLRHKSDLNKVYIDINKAIYKVPSDIKNADVQIIQDFENTCWKFLLGNNLKNNLKSGGINYNAKLIFSITKKHDPNLLYRTLQVNLRELVQKNYFILPFEMEFEKDKKDVSIFTEKLFSKYNYTRIDNE